MPEDLKQTDQAPALIHTGATDQDSLKKEDAKIESAKRLESPEMIAVLSRTKIFHTLYILLTNYLHFFKLQEEYVSGANFGLSLYSEGSPQIVIEYFQQVCLQLGISQHSSKPKLNKSFKDYYNNPDHAVSEGERIRLQINQLEPEERRLGLKEFKTFLFAQKNEASKYLLQAIERRCPSSAFFEPIKKFELADATNFTRDSRPVNPYGVD